MSDTTTLISQKCYPDTKSLREAVAQMRHQLRISYFWRGWNYFVRQRVSYTTICSAKVAMFLFVAVDPQILSCQILKYVLLQQLRLVNILGIRFDSGYHFMHVYDTHAPSSLLFCIFEQYNTYPSEIPTS